MNLFFARTPGLVRLVVMLRFRLRRDFIVRRSFEVAMDDMARRLRKEARAKKYGEGKPSPLR